MKKKDFKLYADECIEQHFVDHLREEHNFNIKSAYEEGLKRKPDEIILKRANEKQRFLLTYDRPFFTNDSLFSFKGLFGIIYLKKSTTYHHCHQLFRLSRLHNKNSLKGKKFQVSYDNILVKSKEAGKIKKEPLDHGKVCLLCEIDEARETF